MNSLLSFSAEPGQQIMGLAISPDGKFIATSTGFHTLPIRVWELQTGKSVTNLVGHGGWVSWLAFSPDGRVLASCSADQMIRLWDVAHWQEVRRLRGHLDSLKTLSFSPDGKTLASGGNDGSILVWELGTKGNPELFTALSQDSAREFHFLPDGRSYAVMQASGDIHIHDTSTAATQSRLLAVDLWRYPATNVWDRGFAVSPHGELILASVDRRTLGSNQRRTDFTVYDWKTRSAVTNIIMEGLDWRILFSTTRKTLATVDLRTNAWLLRFHDSSSWVELGSLVLGEAMVPDWMSFTDTTLAWARWQGHLDVMELPSGKPLRSFRAHVGEWGATAFSPDGKLLATCSENGEAKIWDAATWEEKHLLRGHLMGVHSIAFSPDGRRLATGSAGKETVKLWDVMTGQELATLEGELELCISLRFSAASQAIAAIGLGGGVNLWRAPTWPDIEAMERLNEAREPRK